MILISKEVSALDFISSFAYGQHGMRIRLCLLTSRLKCKHEYLKSPTLFIGLHMCIL